MPLAITLSLALAVAPPPLSPSGRDRLDRSALRLPGDTLGANEVRAVEQLPGRLFPCEELTPEDEARRASAVHERILDGRPAAALPDAARRVFDRLIQELPPRLKPAAFHYRLTVLDRPGRDAFTAGGGEVYVTRAGLDDWLADKERGEAALAFVLADEIAHDALGHTRRAWLWQDCVNDAGGLLPIPAARAFLADALGADSPGRFIYTAAEREEADCFALHLCRNAGFDPDAVLDPARLAARAHLNDNEEGQTSDTDGSLLRLKWLLSERDGLFDDETAHGLFVYDRASGRLARCGPRQVGPGEAPIIFVHGLRGTLYAFDSYLSDYGKRPELTGRPLLVFHYPNDESLSRCGQFLAREMRRCVADPERAVFVCHTPAAWPSAGTPKCAAAASTGPSSWPRRTPAPVWPASRASWTSPASASTCRMDSTSPWPTSSARDTAPSPTTWKRTASSCVTSDAASRRRRNTRSSTGSYSTTSGGCNIRWSSR